MIQEPELRALFKAECDEHLQTLEHGLLRLESVPGDTTALEATFRATHSLKGTGRMMAIEELETIAHACEDLLGQVRRGQLDFTPELLDRLSPALDQMRRIVQEAVESPPAEPDAPEPDTAEWETVRVPAQKLDALLRLAGELAVTTQRLERSLHSVEELASLWEGGAKNQMPSRHHEQLSKLIQQVRRRSGDDIAVLRVVADELKESVLGLRLVPVSTVFNLFALTVRDLARAQGKEVHLVMEGMETTVDKRILEEIKDPLLHMIRNAIDHGIEAPEARRAAGKPAQATLTLRAFQTATRILIELEDDGRGLDQEAIARVALHNGLRTQDQLALLSQKEREALIFEPGFSTKETVSAVSGRGVGMDVVRTNVERLSGTIAIDSRPSQGCRFQLQFPLTLVTTRVLLLQAARYCYAVPIESVDEGQRIARERLFALEGRLTLSVRDEPVPITFLHELMGLPLPSPKDEALTCLILRDGERRAGILVDCLLDEQEIIQKPLSSVLPLLPLITGATVLGTGDICLTLNAPALISAIESQSSQSNARTLSLLETPKSAAPKTLLLVEDSVTTRTWEKRVLEGAGYIVVTAVDGEDAYQKLLSQSFDGMVSDVEMPRLDGFALTERVRQDPRFTRLPILLVTALASEEDRARGLAVGADAYLVKGPLEQRVLLQTLEQCL